MQTTCGPGLADHARLPGKVAETSFCNALTWQEPVGDVVFRASR